MMPSADFFRRFGFFICRDFFEPALCARILSQMRASERFTATVGDAEGHNVVDERVRKAKNVTVAEETSLLISERFLAVKPELEAHFGVPLAEFQNPQLMRYGEGEYYRQHADRRVDEKSGEQSKRRRVSAVVFVNSASETPRDGYYGGGALTFYGLLAHSAMSRLGMPLSGESGMLVAFRSDLQHEVRVVSHGERYTVVAWYG